MIYIKNNNVEPLSDCMEAGGGGGGGGGSVLGVGCCTILRARRGPPEKNPAEMRFLPRGIASPPGTRFSLERNEQRDLYSSSINQ